MENEEKVLTLTRVCYEVFNTKSYAKQTKSQEKLLEERSLNFT